MDNTICELVRKLEQDDIAGGTTISKYVTFDFRNTIDTIDAYINSKHISGPLDDLGREKPFFNIVTAARNIWYRATDIDRKNITVRASKAKYALVSFFLRIFIHDWMRKSRYGVFLNDWGRALATYNSSVVKFVEKGQELYVEVVPWNRMIIDPIDFDSNLQIEVLELTPAQLRENKGYNQEVVDDLITSLSTRKNMDGTNKDNKAEYVRLYEVHGVLPLSMLTNKEEDANTFVQQMQTISFIKTEESEDSYEDFILIKGKESESPYMITHLIKEDGRSIGIGAVEHLFEPQWMMNHSSKLIKDQLDLASKLFFQTADTRFVGQNAIESMETGDIFIHEFNKPLTQVNSGSHDISSLQSFANQWKSLSQEITSTPDSLMGNTAPSGTAWRQIEALQQEAHSLFELMVENKGLAIEDMFNKKIIPFLIKNKMNSSEEIVASLSDNGIDQIDAMYLKSESIRRANKKNAEALFNQAEQGLLSKPLDLTSPEQEMQSIQQELYSMGNQRFFAPSKISSLTWKDLFKDFEGKVEVDVTGESSFIREDLATLTTVLQTIADPTKQAILKTPEGKMIFNAILEKTGTISPVQIKSLPNPTQALTGGGTQTVGTQAGGAL